MYHLRKSIAVAFLGGLFGKRRGWSTAGLREKAGSSARLF